MADRLPPSRMVRPGFHSNQPGVATPSHARQGSIKIGQGSGIPTPASKNIVEAKNDDIELPSSPSVRRAQSIRKPQEPRMVTRTGTSQIQPPSTPVSSQRPAAVGRVRGDSKSQVVASPLPSALSRAASTRIAGSTTSVPNRTASTRIAHGRATSSVTASNVQEATSGLMRSGSTISRQTRSKSLISSPSNSTSSPATLATEDTSGRAARKLVATGSKASGLKTTGSTRMPPPAMSASGIKSRPTFNTLQQHYSPAKPAPKPPVPPSKLQAKADEAFSAGLPPFEIIKAQSELLYLCILHEAAGTTLSRYQGSAHEALSSLYGTMQQEVREAAKEEQGYQQKLNLRVVAEWARLSESADMEARQGFAEKVQRLSGCIKDVFALAGPEGRYAAVVGEFAAWKEGVDSIFRARRENSSHGSVGFVQGLGKEWHESHASVLQRVRLVGREMDLLPPAPASAQEEGGADSQAALVQMLRVLQSLVSGMREEMEGLLELERMVLAEEKEWVEKAVEGLSLDEVQSQVRQQVAAWQQ